MVRNWPGANPACYRRPMGSLRRLAAVLSVFAMGGLGVGAGCGTTPVALDGCRQIELARCQQAAACPGLGVGDEAACERFYRDQCLHGLATDQDPGAPAIGKCVAAIQKAGDCAAKGTPGPCVLTVYPAVAACDVIAHPELASDCAFLVPTAPPAVTATPPADAAAEAADDAGSDAPAE